MMEEILSLFESPFVRRMTYIVIVIIVVYFSTALIKKGLNRTIKSTGNKYRARKATNVFGYVLLILALIFVYNDQLGNFGVALGVTGAGIAFALQEVIMSVAGWVFIVFSNRIAVGQRVKIGELKGDIIDIGIISTTFMEIGDWVSGDLYNGRIVSVANSFVFKEKIQNYSAEYPFLWDEIEIPIRLESDYELTKKILEKVAIEICGEFAAQSEAEWKALANKFNVESAEVKPMITMSFDQNWITFTIRYIVDFKKRRTTKDRIFVRILQEISAHQDKIRVATAAMEVTIPENKSDK